MENNRWLAKFTVTVNWKKRRHKVSSETFSIQKETEESVTVLHDDTVTVETIPKSEMKNFILLNQINDLRAQIRAEVKEFDFRSPLVLYFWVAAKESIPEYYYGDFIVLAIKHDLLVYSWERKKAGKTG